MLLRRDALGNFGELLHDVAKDPAMLQYLDGASNRKGKPNENFAREVMELFTLGEGHYTQRDVSEAARAYTGWSLDPDTQAYVWRANQHDDGDKTVLGQTGPFDGDQVLDILLARPETATFVTTKLWREFVSDTPDPARIAPIAAQFRASHYDIKVALRGLFLSDAFWDDDDRGVLVKSPAEFVVGTLRAFDIGYDNTAPFAAQMRTLRRKSVLSAERQRMAGRRQTGSTVRHCLRASNSSNNCFARLKPPVRRRHEQSDERKDRGERRTRQYADDSADAARDGACRPDRPRWRTL